MRLKLRVALASLAVLVTGSLIAPRATQTRLSPPEERAAPLLEEQAQSRAAARPFDGIQHVRSRIGGGVVTIPGVAERAPRITSDYREPRGTGIPPSGFGVVVTAAGEVLTHEDALGGRTAVRIDPGDGPLVDAHVSGYEPATGLVWLSVSGVPGGGSLPVFAARAEPGALAAAYTRSGGRDAIVPVFITSATPGEYGMAASGGPLLPGTPIYNLSGELLAIATGSTSRPTAIAARDAANRLMARVQSGAGQPSSIGVAFQPLVGAIARVLGQTGALVADIVSAGPAASSGVEAGDVLLAVGEVVVQSPEAARAAIVSLPLGSPTTLQVRRADRTVSLRVTAMPAFEIGALAGDPDDRDDVIAIDPRELFPAPVLAAAGIAPDARVISINRRPVSSRADALRELRRSRSPALLYVQAPDGTRFFAVVDQPS